MNTTYNGELNDSSLSVPAGDENVASLRSESKSAYSVGGISKSGKAEDTETATKNHGDPSLQKVVEEFASGTTVHGLSYVFDSKNFQLWKRLIWLGFVLAGLGLTVYYVNELVMTYVQYPTTTSSVTVASDSKSFPQVTVCNTNPLSSSKANYTITNEEALTSASFDVTDTIHFTRFTGLGELEPSEVWTPVITYFGMCFTFVTNEKVSEPGQFSGLHFLAVLNQYDYLPTEEDGSDLAGLMIFVHQNGTTISDQNPSVMASPGVENRITISHINHTRVPIYEGRKARCYSEAPAYTRNQCRANCWNNAFRKKCGCRLYGDSESHPDYCHGDVWCNVSSEELEFDNENGYCEQNCTKLPCAEEIFPLQLTSVPFSEVALEFLVAGENADIAEIKKEFVGVHINFGAIQTESITETRNMYPSQLLAQIGGNLGLFLGISFVSALEICGELLALRMLPRLWGDRRLHGIGSKEL